MDDELNNNEAKGILKVISGYSKALNFYDRLYIDDRKVIDNIL